MTMNSQPQTQEEVVEATRRAIAESTLLIVRTPSTLAVSEMGQSMRNIWDSATRLAVQSASGGFVDGYTVPGSLRATTDRHLMESRSEESASLMSYIWEYARGQR